MLFLVGTPTFASAQIGCLGPRADINRCTNRHRTAETFGQILSWLLETVRLRSAPELAVGARAEN
jgi:hypothetical protein